MVIWQEGPTLWLQQHMHIEAPQEGDETGP